MKISQYTSGAPAQLADVAPFSRGTSPIKLSAQNILQASQLLGSLGINGAPSNWAASYGALQLGGTTSACLVGLSGDAHLINNAYHDGVSWKYIANGYAANLYFTQNDGVNNIAAFRYGASGLAGATISWTTALNISRSGQFGIGIVPTAFLEIGADSAKKPSTSTWTISSDERLKQNIVPADLARCLEIVRTLPLKRYTWKDSTYSHERVGDRSKLGWIAQDVQKVFSKAVTVSEFAKVPVPDGFEEIDEPITAEEERETPYVEVVDGVPTFKVRTETVSVPIVDMVPVVDEAGQPVMLERQQDDGTVVSEQATHPVPRMRKVQRAKTRTDVIEDCLSLNADQIYAALYGAVQALAIEVDQLKAQLAAKG